MRKVKEDVIKYKIIEIEKAVSLSDWSKEDEEAISRLKHSPDFLTLRRKWAIQRALIQSALNNQRHEDLASVARLQGNLDTFNWLDRQMRIEVDKLKPVQLRDPYETEKEEFDKIAAAISIVGSRANGQSLG